MGCDELVPETKGDVVTRTPPEMTPPCLGVSLGEEFAYVRRESAEAQAQQWNDVLRDDPFHGPSTGLVVGVFPIKDADGRFPLVWVPAS